MKNLILVCCFLFGLSTVANAQTGFLKIDGISGQSTTNSYKDWISIESFELGIHQKKGAVGSGRSRGGAKNKNVVFTKKIDNATTYLIKSLNNGKVFNKVVIVVPLKNSSNKLIEYTFDKLVFQGYDVAIDSKENIESLEFKYEALTVLLIENNTKEHKETYNYRLGN